METVKIQFDPAKLKLVDPRTLKKDPNNRNKHPDEQIDRFCKLLQTYGMRWPIIVSEATGVIKAGEGRLLAALKLGMPQVLVSYQEFESEQIEYGFGISDNAIASWAELDLASIQTDVAALGDGYDIDLLGIEDFALADVEVLPPGCDEDEVPEANETICKLGDLWTLGSHRLMCGDSTSIDAVEKLMDGQKADMVFTDPPYGMNLDTDYSSMGGDNNSHNSAKGLAGKKGLKHRAVLGDDEDFDPGIIFGLFGYCNEIFLWGADYYAERLVEKNKGSWIVWDKRVDENFDKMWGSAFELCWSKAKHKRDLARIRFAGVYGTESQDTKGRVHPTQKPIQLAEWFFERWGKDTKNIVDLFGGSGSTLIACEKTDRKCFMMELDPHYCDVIIARWEKYSGKKASLING